MKGLDAGRLDRRVTILRVVGEEAAGRMKERRQVWGEIATVWASVRSVSDSERWHAQEGQEAAVASHRFRIRWGQNVSPLDRLRFDGREFKITGVKELDRRLGQEITAVARAEGI